MTSENSREKLNTIGSKNPVDFLRTPEQALVERERRGETPVVLRRNDGQNELVVLGLPHTFSYEEINQYKDILREQHPDLFLRGIDLIIVEGTPLEFDPRIDPAQIIKEHGETSYLAYIAKSMGVRVESWDLDFNNWFKNILERHSTEDILAWLGAAALKLLFEKNRKGKSVKETDHISQSEIKDLKLLFEKFINAELVEYALKKNGSKIAADKIDFENLFKSYCGKSLSEITFGDIAKLSDPYADGPTSAVIRDLNEIRDKKAMDTLQEAKSKYKSIFMSAGLDHVITWEPAIDALYQNQKQVQ